MRLDPTHQRHAHRILDRLKAQATQLLVTIAPEDDPELAILAIVEAFIAVRAEAQSEKFEEVHAMLYRALPTHRRPSAIRHTRKAGCSEADTPIFQDSKQSNGACRTRAEIVSTTHERAKARAVRRHRRWYYDDDAPVQFRHVTATHRGALP